MYTSQRKFFFFVILFSLLTTRITSTNRLHGAYGGLFRLPIPHQLSNLIDLAAPVHIRFETDGIKHVPVIRTPLIDLLFRGQIINKPGVHHLIHGPGIPW